MELMTISELSKGFNITTRTLRYYEQIGILKSKKKEDYAYRVYDEDALIRLQQIIILRKLRIPLKQIGVILGDAEQNRMVEIFQENLMSLDHEITALSTIRSVLQRFVSYLNNYNGVNAKLNFLDDNEIMQVVESLSLSKIKFKEERPMEELNKANEILDNLKDVRILYLPPATVASSHYIGDNPEEVAGGELDDFIRSIKLQQLKPDLRVYGFNNPCPREECETYGYEFWVTIPEDMKVPESLQKKYFEGGLYAAHCIKMGDFHEWQAFYQWICNHDLYEFDEREPLGMNGTLEEHLNAFTYYQSCKEKSKFEQIDLLIPIRLKTKIL
ncbi:effector binding domain-containing protein [Anaeromicropila herbilytica]|uniref:MerR family transcriptional regulator n=1 Tax=Anaeromicropila herbilytica TaxID=2785025 RepID=A0A7R7EI11_9FIRM|nr:effector binding domain-containing protein [Anaeromicropila herbilytica]BCN29113.1 MerR family transcriptional regulator [Anaeromicropila herbilytica]